VPLAEQEVSHILIALSFKNALKSYLGASGGTGAAGGGDLLSGLQLPRDAAA